MERWSGSEPLVRHQREIDEEEVPNGLMQQNLSSAYEARQVEEVSMKMPL
jgi:hypothetical protein